MIREDIIKELELFGRRLQVDVLNAYEQRGDSFGSDRFRTWTRKFTLFLDQNLPSESSTLKEKLTLSAFAVSTGESDAEIFWRIYGEKLTSYIDSLIIDLKNNEYDLPQLNENSNKSNIKDSSNTDRTQIFIVHGHNSEAKEKTARFIEKLGFKSIILNEQANRGLTIIEKIEKYSNVGFAVVLYTPDDLGNTKAEADKGNLLLRGRQNVIFEHGYLIGKIGRANVVPLVEGDDLELPSDISGIVYISDKNWQLDIAKELKAANYTIDFNKLL